MGEVFKYISKHKKIILIIIAIILILVVMVFPAALYNIILGDGIYNENSPGNTPAVVRKHLRAATSNEIGFTGSKDGKFLNTKTSADGGYALNIDLDKLTDEIVEELEKEGGKLNTYFSSGNLHEYLKKMIKAEYVTQYPDLRSSDKIGTKVSDGEFQGAIKFVRHKSDGSERTLEYIPLGVQDVVNGNTLYGLINQANGKDGVSADVINEAKNKISNYFSIDTDGNLILAKWNETITKTVNGEYETSYVSDEAEADYTEKDKQNLNSASERIQSEYTAHIINYKSLISKYTVPFNYLWAFLVCGRDEEFINDFVDLILESKIEISIYDNLTQIENRGISSYNNNTWKWTRTGNRTLVDGSLDGSEDIGEWSGPGLESTIHNYEIDETKTYSNSIVVAVTNLDIWYMKYSANYTYNVEDPGKDEEITRLESEQLDDPNNLEAINSGDIQYIEGTWTTVSTRTESDTTKDDVSPDPEGSTTPTHKDTTTPSDTDESTPSDTDESKTSDTDESKSSDTDESKPSDVDDTTSVDKIIEEQERNDEATQTRANQRVIISEYHAIQYKYTLDGDPKVIEKTNAKLKEGDEGYPNFSTLYLNSHDARRNISGEASKIESWLFDILQNNSDTVNMVELTKYMMYCTTGSNYGVTEFNFGNLYPTNVVSGLYGGTIEEQIWFALLDEGYSKEAAAGVLGNLQAESGFITNNLENEKESLVGMNDEQYTESVDNGIYTEDQFINDSCGYGLAQWTDSTRKKGLYKFAKEVKGVSISDVSMQIEYLLGEISQTGGANGCAIFQMGKERGGYTYDSWITATTPEEAAEAFCKVFERPKSDVATKRKTNARIAYDKYQNMSKSDAAIGNIELTGENKTKMIAMLNEAVRIANDDRYGYSQDKRNQEFYYDCSSLVARLYRQYFGLSVPGTTAGYPNYSLYDMGSPSSTSLKPGDVLWRRTGDKGHVTLYIGNGNYVAAHTDEKPQADQISVYQDNPSNYMNVYRFIGI